MEATFCNYPMYRAEFPCVTDCIRYLRAKGFTRIAASPEAEAAWTDHVNELAVGNTVCPKSTLVFSAPNIPGKKPRS